MPEIRIISRESTNHFTHDPGSGGYWVQAEVFVPEGEIEPEPGPTYDVWIAEPEAWTWIHDQRFTCEDDPDGAGARLSAHEYARYLRNTYPYAFVAVRRADQGLPLPVRQDP